MAKNKKIKKRAPRRSFAQVCDLCTPDQGISLRRILDRLSQGLPCNATMKKHEPLPPDGEDLEDFDTGTEEYVDINDALPVLEKIEQAEAEVKEAQKKAAEDAQQKAIDEAVAQKLAELQAAQQ